jgi:hypothetical protein
MTIRDHNLDSVAPILATFKIKQTTPGTDDLKDANLGQAVKLTASNEVGPLGASEQLLGKLVALTLRDGDDGSRLATVQVAGICRLPVSSTVPSIGNRVIGGTTGTVKQATALTGYDPAGGAIARGTVLAVNGSTDCIILLN